MPAFRRILHPTDFSKASDHAFREAVRLTRRSRGELVLLHVVSPPAVVLEDSFMTAKTWQRIEAGTLTDARRRLERLRKRAAGSGVRVRAVVARGVPFEQIVAVARQQRADLIVIGTHGRTGFARALMGSIAERVVGRAPVPVLTVRGSTAGRRAA